MEVLPKRAGGTHALPVDTTRGVGTARTLWRATSVAECRVSGRVSCDARRARTDNHSSQIRTVAPVQLQGPTLLVHV